MNKKILVIFVAIASFVVAMAVQVNPSSAESDTSNFSWLQKVVSEGKKFVPGSSRDDLLKLFSADAGDQPSPYRYLLKSCQLIRADISLSKTGWEVVTVSPLTLDLPTRAKPYSAHEEWLKCLMKDCTAIKPGMTRAALLKNFSAEAGLQAMLPTRYVHKKAALVRIDVNFEPVDKTKAKSEPVIKTVSRPYVDLVVCD